MLLFALAKTLYNFKLGHVHENFIERKCIRSYFLFFTRQKTGTHVPSAFFIVLKFENYELCFFMKF